VETSGCQFKKSRRRVVFVSFQWINLDIYTTVQAPEILEVLVSPLLPFTEYIQTPGVSGWFPASERTINLFHTGASSVPADQP
jgi:hypothetical protein